MWNLSESLDLEDLLFHSPMRGDDFPQESFRTGLEDCLLPYGNIPPVITPMRNGRIDEKGIESLVQHLYGLGVRHLFVMGETGEFRFLGNDQRLEALEYFAKYAKPRGIILYGNATAETTSLTCENYNEMCRFGYDVAIFAPCWGDHKDLPRRLNDMGVTIPFGLYNNPGITDGRNITLEDIEPFPEGLILLKDSSGVEDILVRYLQMGKTLDFVVYQGDEKQIFDYLDKTRSDGLAIQGSVSSMGNINDLPILIHDQNLTTCERAITQEYIDKCVYPYTSSRHAVAASIKYLLSKRGIINDAQTAIKTQNLDLFQTLELDNLFERVKKS